MPTLIIPPPYQGPTRGRGCVEVESGTLRATLEEMERRFPGFRAQVVGESGGLHRFVKLFVNGELLERGDLDRKLEAGDELEIVAAIAGG
jgi:molybdopterin converting factor small subunit